MQPTYKYGLFFLLCVFSITTPYAQVQINFQPSVHGRSIDGLTFFQVNNLTNTEFSASLRISIQEEKSGKVAELTARTIVIQKGLNSFTRFPQGSIRTVFGRSSLASILQQTGKLAEGDYEYCFEITPTDDKPGLQDQYEQCFQLALQPRSPLLLADPVDEEKICNQRPPFLWQPPMPADLSARYRIIVAELKVRQSPAEALSFNLPVINISEVREPRLNYPAHLQSLDTGKTYVWQVYYSVNNILLTKSEIWTFRIDCEEPKAKVADDSYRELKESGEGDYYIADEHLKFAVNNYYNEGNLQYSIGNLSDPSKTISKLPKFKLLTGLNKYQLNLSEYRDFKPGEHYLLTVFMPNGQRMYLRFTYQE